MIREHLDNSRAAQWSSRQRNESQLANLLMTWDIQAVPSRTGPTQTTATKTYGQPLWTCARYQTYLSDWVVDLLF